MCITAVEKCVKELREELIEQNGGMSGDSMVYRDVIITKLKDCLNGSFKREDKDE